MEEPAVNDGKLHVSVAALNVTPAGRLGLEILLSPWAGRVSMTIGLDATEGPEFDTTTE
jgi:hypothetical protein